jgi:pantetheine-phosphate adenylyltransferase
MSKVVGIYPGTFDPMTIGHSDVLIKASAIVDELIIAVSESDAKNPLFSDSERCEIVESYIERIHRHRQLNKNCTISVKSFSGLLVEFASDMSANIIIRGLRAVSDFEYEFQMACMNSRMESSIQTIFIPASEQNQFISSRLVKEIASLGGDISNFVNEETADKIKENYNKS